MRYDLTVIYNAVLNTTFRLNTVSGIMIFTLKHDPQFVRFLAVGVLNSLFGYGCFALLLYFGVHYAAALFFATAAGVLFNFKTTSHLVFNSRNNRLILHFSATYIFVYAVNVTSLKFLTLIGVDVYYGGAALIFPMAVLAYILNKRFVFNNE